VNPQASRSELVHRRYSNLGLDDAQWNQYLLMLYQASDAQLATSLPKVDQVDLIYDSLVDVDGIDGDQFFDCGNHLHRPFRHGAPHQPLVAWMYRSPPFQAIPSDTWVEVTHCGGSGFESHASWYYVVTGSAVYVNVGKTIAFNGHEEAVRHFLDRACINAEQDQCNEELLEDLPRAALAAGYKSMQFVLHRDFDCWDDDYDVNGVGHELMIFQTSSPGILGSGGDMTCPPGIEFRTGVDASLPCDCVESDSLRSVRGKCVVCAGSAVGMPNDR